MDVTKLFEVSEDKLQPLASAKLDDMIEKAIAQSQIPAQIRVAANENSTRFKRALAIAAALALVIAASFELSPPTSAPPSLGSDAYDEISDLLILETLNDLS